jgi:hypothetical protein
MNHYFQQLAAALLDLTREAAEYVTVGTTVGVMVYHPSDGPHMETWPHLGIVIAGRDDTVDTDTISYVFKQSLNAIGKPKGSDPFEEDGFGLVFDVSNGREVFARVVLSLILPSGTNFTINEDWFIHEFALAINDKLFRDVADYLVVPIARCVHGRLYVGGPVHDEEIEYGPEEEEEEDLTEGL